MLSDRQAVPSNVQIVSQPGHSSSIPAAIIASSQPAG